MGQQQQQQHSTGLQQQQQQHHERLLAVYGCEERERERERVSNRERTEAKKGGRGRTKTIEADSKSGEAPCNGSKASDRDGGRRACEAGEAARDGTVKEVGEQDAGSRGEGEERFYLCKILSQCIVMPGCDMGTRARLKEKGAFGKVRNLNRV